MQTIIRTQNNNMSFFLNDNAVFEVFELQAGKNYSLLCWIQGYPNSESDKRPTIQVYSTDNLSDCQRSLTWILKMLSENKEIIQLSSYRMKN